MSVHFYSGLPQQINLKVAEHTVTLCAQSHTGCDFICAMLFAYPSDYNGKPVITEATEKQRIVLANQKLLRIHFTDFVILLFHAFDQFNLFLCS